MDIPPTSYRNAIYMSKVVNIVFEITIRAYEARLFVLLKNIFHRFERLMRQLSLIKRMMKRSKDGYLDVFDEYYSNVHEDVDFDDDFCNENDENEDEDYD